MAENITVPAVRALDAPVARPATGPGSGPAPQDPPVADERAEPARLTKSGAEKVKSGSGEQSAEQRRKKAARRRVRSSTVALGSMGVLAAALAACSSEPDRRCVDRNSYSYGGGYKVVDSSQCRNGSSGSTGGTGGGGSSGGSGRYGSDRSSNAGWYYGGDSKSGYASDGSFNKSSVSSGGFGCSGKGSGGG
ncbi:hypothetical protein [Streptomyces koyangensis]|uniref:Lipoprotein n=1 Tax=Streptomyces koyangensis TaxID=188770 RepID=A0ABX7EDT1_9ACTN|nr:hypothetical protein [Streptomyces koyangensis]QRF02598.1 hypothetical protein G9U55_10550 [Streptomyces koyangensis]